MKKDTRNQDGGWTGFVLFYLFILLAFVLAASLGGCTRHQAVLVQPNTLPPRPELMQQSKLPAPDTTESEPLKRCIKNLANTRQGCGQIADKHNGLVAYEKKRAAQAGRRVE